jgi:peroxiredoxin
MAATAEPILRGMIAPEFTLPGTDGQRWTRDAIVGPHGLLVAFICNHCPYVQAIVDRLVRDARALQDAGIGVVAISSNDVSAYPEDSFDNMRAFAQKHGFSFPYLYDETQEVARDYGAVCTPDFFGFNRDLQLEYRGRLDASGRQPAAADARRELLEAMTQIAATGRGPAEQTPSIGCSIKWKA